MKYQVLARKYRPQDFTALMGQEHVRQALENALSTGRLHHAYLFSGTRGVGKTTIARVLAKALNCEQGVIANPCGECDACREIEQGCFVDLIEVDAASRTKVEDTRELLDNVQYAPVSGRYKIYLIDEVHMLSGHSFNALLKTLEEPPEHVKFLLATTDPQKLPVTVLSRCLKFNLKRLAVTQIIQQLENILNQEQIDFAPTALKPIAVAADGSMRDALSLLDQAIAFSGGEIGLAEVDNMLGNVSAKKIFHVLHALAEHDAKQMIEALRETLDFGMGVENSLAEIVNILQQIALYQLVPEAINNAHYEAEELRVLGGKISPEDIQLFYQIALNGRKDIDLSPFPQGALEMILLRMLAFQPVEMCLENNHTAVQPLENPDKKKPNFIADKQLSESNRESKKNLDSVQNTPTRPSQQAGVENKGGGKVQSISPNRIPHKEILKNTAFAKEVQTKSLESARQTFEPSSTQRSRASKKNVPSDKVTSSSNRNDELVPIDAYFQEHSCIHAETDQEAADYALAFFSASADDSLKIPADDSSKVSADDSSKISVDDSSKISVDDSSKISVDDSSKISVDDSSKISVDDSSKISVDDSSKISVDDSSKISVDDSSKISVDDSSKISVDDSSKIPHSAALKTVHSPFEQSNHPISEESTFSRQSASEPKGREVSSQNDSGVKSTVNKSKSMAESELRLKSEINEFERGVVESLSQHSDSQALYLQWHEMIKEIDCAGFEREIFMHSSLLEKRESTQKIALKFGLDIAHKELLDDKIINRLRQKLSEYFQHEVKLEFVELSARDAERLLSPKKQELKNAQRRLEDAQQSFRNDEAVNLLVNSFVGKIIHESIKPV